MLYVNAVKQVSTRRMDFGQITPNPRYQHHCTYLRVECMLCLLPLEWCVIFANSKSDDVFECRWTHQCVEVEFGP